LKGIFAVEELIDLKPYHRDHMAVVGAIFGSITSMPFEVKVNNI